MEAAITTEINVSPKSLPAMPEFCLYSMHAVDRMLERSNMTPEDVLDILQSGRGIWLNNPQNHWQKRGYLLIYSVKDAQFYVVVVSVAEKTAGIVTILTQAQYENDRGPLDRSTLSRAIRSTAPEDVAKAWKRQGVERTMTMAERIAHRRSELQVWKAAKFAVIVDYRQPSGVVERAEFFDPPGSDSADVLANPPSVLEQEGFWSWFAEKATEFEVPVELVFEMKVRPPGGTALQVTLG